MGKVLKMQMISTLKILEFVFIPIPYKRSVTTYLKNEKERKTKIQHNTNTTM